MRRRSLLKLMAVGLLPLSARAQQDDKVWRIGFFYGGSRQSARDTGRYQAFMQGMQALGYAEQKNLVMVERYLVESAQAPTLAKELVQAEPDLIVTSGGLSLQALQQVGVKLPVVVVISADPVQQGVADSLSRPGRNFTGFHSNLHDLFPRHVKLVKEALPHSSRLAVLSNPRNREHPALERAVLDEGYANGMRVNVVKVGGAAELDAAFADMAQQKAEALLILGDTSFVQHFREIAQRCIQQRMVSTFSGREYPDLGGFMSYGPNFREHYRASARFVDRILKGAKPAELPFSQLPLFELVINARTAKAIGVPIAEPLAQRADVIIE